MLFDSQVIVKGIMLGAYAYFLSDGLHVGLSQHLYRPTGGLEHAGQHGNCCGFACAVVAQ